MPSHRKGVLVKHWKFIGNCTCLKWRRRHQHLCACSCRNNYSKQHSTGHKVWAQGHIQNLEFRAFVPAFRQANWSSTIYALFRSSPLCRSAEKWCWILKMYWNKCFTKSLFEKEKKSYSSFTILFSLEALKVNFWLVDTQRVNNLSIEQAFSLIWHWTSLWNVN